MNVRPMIGDWEVPHIESIEALDRRAFVQLDIPGRVGSLFQDMNSAPVRVAIRGSLYGDEKRNEFLTTVRGQFQAGEPATFVADIITATELTYVVIEQMQFLEQGVQPDQTDYVLVLRESPPPPPPPDPFGGLDAGLLDQAAGLVDAAAGALDAIDALGSLPELSDPTAPLTSTLDGVQSTVGNLADAGAALAELFGEGD